MTGSGTVHQVAELDVAFHALDGGDDVAVRGPGMFGIGWPSYRRWYLRDGEEARPTYAECLRQLRTHLPELLPDYVRLVEAVGGGDLEARFLSHWAPPPLFAACSLATWTNGANLLVRNYDYPPQMCDATVLATRWGGTRVLGMSDCVLGLLDGVNEHGLSAAIAFGGRRVVGHGFGVGIIVRYVLQTATNVGEALDILRRVPVQVSYNIAVVDCSGLAAVAHVAPDRPMAVSSVGIAGNRQGETEWAEHARFCATEEREAALLTAVTDQRMTASGLVDTFLREPVYRPVDDAPWGTLYTAAYDCDRTSVDLVWPDDRWRLSLRDFTEGRKIRRLRVAVPPPEHIPSPPVAHGRPLLIA